MAAPCPSIPGCVSSFLASLQQSQSPALKNCCCICSAGSQGDEASLEERSARLLISLNELYGKSPMFEGVAGSGKLAEPLMGWRVFLFLPERCAKIR